MSRYTEDERLEKQLLFIAEADKVKDIFRQTYIGEKIRPENDAEHSWHLALMCMVLSEYANEETDVFHAMKMALIHDMIEIDAGDTYAYDEEANKTKRERELKAAERIFNILPVDQAANFRALWDEFEEAKTPEAHLALAMDVLHPVMMNDLKGGVAWREHSVTRQQAYKRISKIRPGSETLYEVCKAIIDKNAESGNILS